MSAPLAPAALGQRVLPPRGRQRRVRVLVGNRQGEQQRSVLHALVRSRRFWNIGVDRRTRSSSAPLRILGLEAAGHLDRHRKSQHHAVALGPLPLDAAQSPWRRARHVAGAPLTVICGWRTRRECGNRAGKTPRSGSTVTRIVSSNGYAVWQVSFTGTLRRPGPRPYKGRRASPPGRRPPWPSTCGSRSWE